MKKVLFLAAATAAIVSSCSQSAESVIEDNSNNIETSQTPVNMSVYTASSTRAGNTGNIDDVNALVAKGGFGVFAYQTGGDNYENTAKKELTPNFMYNEAVTGTVSGDGDNKTVTWSYSPIKFWPNDNTVADNTTPNAKGETNTGKVSFFAYAPYTAVDASKGTPTASTTSGITAVSKNSDPGDPTVSYKLAASAKDNVDLLWGTTGTNGTTTSGTTAQDGTKLTGGKAKVNVNLTKMKNGGKVQFNFIHALAKLGGSDASSSTTAGLLIKADPDDPNYSGFGTETKITVSSIVLTTDGTNTTTGATSTTNQQSIVTSGTLNLATGAWTLGTAAETTLAQTIAQSKTSTKDAELADAIQEPETVATGEAGFNAVPNGVTKDAQSVYKTEAAPLLFIPGTTLPRLKVTITYVVRTKDSKLSKGYSETTNVITKIVDFGNKTVEMNKRYTLTLILGVNSVKFDATVAPWTNTTATGTDSSTSTTIDNTDVNLPLNVK